MAAPKAYAEVKEGKVTNLVMMTPSVAEAKNANESFPNIYRYCNNNWRS